MSGKNMEDLDHKLPLVEDTNVRVLRETEASQVLDDQADYPLAGSNSIYSAILSRNEAVRDAKRLKTFMELRDKYVKKKVLFEDPLFPACDSSLFYSHQKPPMKFVWKRPSVRECSLITRDVMVTHDPSAWGSGFSCHAIISAEKACARLKHHWLAL